VYVCWQLCEDIAKDLKTVSTLVSVRPIDDSLSLWLEVGMIKPVLRLFIAVADFISLQQHLSRTYVNLSLLYTFSDTDVTRGTGIRDPSTYN